MAEQRSLTLISERDYEAIADAVMETARGRWFLGEYARRNRTADTQVLLTAIEKLEHAVAGEHSARGLDRLRHDLLEMARTIARTKEEVAAVPDGGPGPRLAASQTLDGIVRHTERATSDILEAAEHIQEAAWTLREGGTDAVLCDELDRRATDIYTACSFQDLTAQRMGRIVQTLRYLESRIDSMVDLCGGAPDAATSDAPDLTAAVNPDLSQGDVDLVITEVDLFAPDPPLSEHTWEDPQPIALEEVAIEDAECDAVDWGMVSPQHVEESVSRESLPPEPDLATAVTLLDSPRFMASRSGLGSGHELVRGPATINVAAFAEIDALDTREKLRRFT